MSIFFLYIEKVYQGQSEAMTKGISIIATNVRGCREVVFPSENGLLVEIQNICTNSREEHDN